MHFAVKCSHFEKVGDFIEKAKELIEIDVNHRLILAQMFHGKLERIFEKPSYKSYLRMLDHDS